MSLTDAHLALGAVLAPDNIPLHYGDQKAEYRAALEKAVLMDRSHEGRIEAKGRDRINLIQRISTNDLTDMRLNEGRPTIFTNANGRILDRIVVYNRGDSALITTEPGRGTPLLHFLRRQVFFNDEAIFTDLAPDTHQFILYGRDADAIAEGIQAGAGSTAVFAGLETSIAGVPVYLAKRKPMGESQWTIITPKAEAASVWNAILETGAAHGLVPAGSLVYNAFRIRAGRPGIGHELSQDYIPLEAGLWDEVSFTKGCYTGQEIIARMESRNRLAKTMVRLQLSAWVEAPANLYHESKQVGTLTSSVITPDGEILGIGFVKVPLAVPDQGLSAGDGNIETIIVALAGAQPPQLVES
jgi:tRNA-modifying protein YgfZ